MFAAIRGAGASSVMSEPGAFSLEDGQGRTWFCFALPDDSTATIDRISRAVMEAGAAAAGQGDREPMRIVTAPVDTIEALQEELTRMPDRVNLGPEWEAGRNNPPPD